MSKLLFNPLSASIITLVVVLFLVSLHKTDERIAESTQTIHQLNENVTDLEKSVTQLQKEVDRASSSAQREKILRDELLMKKPGEYVLQVPIPEGEVSQNTLNTALSPLEAWKALLF